MGRKYKLVFALVAAGFGFAGTACAQDPPSLGDLARQQRQQKEQSKAAPRVITNEEIPEHAGPQPALAPDHGDRASSMPASSNGAKQSAEHWKSQIQTQKGQIA